MALLNFSVKGVNENPTKLVARARNFKVIVDEPAELGGTDHGANPVEYLLAGYAGCLNVVAHIVAKERELDIKKLSIEVDGDINPGRLMGFSKEERAGFQNIRVNIHLDTDADTKAIENWLQEVESRCPINDNLRNQTPVQVNVSTFEFAE
jgi:uncharacterized OsmC-like protein